MRILLSTLCLLLVCGCASRSPADNSSAIVSMQIIDRNGFSETISNKDRLSSYQGTDFLTPQPYQKVLRIYGRNRAGQSTSKITSYHENGSVWQFLEVIDGRAHGLYQEWYPNGQKKVEANLIEGVADISDLAQATWVFEGNCSVFDERASLIAEFIYEKGLLNAPAHYYYPDGKLKKIIPYSEGEVHGALQTFGEEGEILEEILFEKGEKHGNAIAYWNPSQKLYIESYEMGRLLEGSYYDSTGACVAQIKGGTGKQAQFEDMKLHSLASYVNGVPDGEVQIFDKFGNLHCSYHIKFGKKNGEEWEYYLSEKKENKPQPKLCLHWHEDKIEGQVKTWYPNGQIESQREISNNKKQGVAFAWYKNGDLMLMEEYENDLLLKGNYFKKGDKKAVSKIESGKGTATLYTSDGIFLKKVSYEKGKPSFKTEA